MLSVIIPTHNRRALLSRAVESVLAQRQVELELIVVDDASTDGTPQWLASLTDPRVRYACLEKQSGACAARNRGIEMARGDFIAFQDSDDTWQPEKCLRQMEILDRTGADIVFCAFAQYAADGRLLRTYPDPRVCSGFVSFARLLDHSMASTQTILCRAECLRDTRFDESFPRLQDHELMLRLSRKWKVYYHADVLVSMYEQPDSISRSPQKLLWACKRLFALYKADYLRDEMALRHILTDIRCGAAACGENAYRLFFAQISPDLPLRLRVYLLWEGGKELLRIPYRKAKRILTQLLRRRPA